MAAEHVVAARKANTYERLEAVRSRLGSLLGIEDSRDDDAPGPVKRDKTLFDLFRLENLIVFLEGATTRIGALKTENANLSKEIKQLKAQLAAATKAQK